MKSFALRNGIFVVEPSGQDDPTSNIAYLNTADNTDNSLISSANSSLVCDLEELEANENSKKIVGHTELL
ncbi:hypothetical protein CHS0354_026194, partial [Potamilus streckersoni]